jgi:hypothetical protein
MSNHRGRNGLGESHILAAQFHVEAAPDSLLVDVPYRHPGGPVPNVAAQIEFYSAVLVVAVLRLAAEHAPGERRMIEDGKPGGKILPGDAASLMRRGVA